MAAQQERATRWGRWAVHPVLFAVYPVLAQYAANTGELGLDGLPRPLVAVVLAALALVAVGRVVTRRWWKGAIFASIILAAFFVLWGTMAKPLLYGMGERWDVKIRYLFLAYCCGVGAILVWAALRRGNGAKATKALNVVAAVLVVMALGQATMTAVQSWGKAVPVTSEIEVVEQAAPEGLPDVYFIVLDSYLRADVLANIYGYDNSPFLDAMRGRGFFVADQGHVSYTSTTLSLPACLNMEFLENLSDAPRAGEGEGLRLDSLYHDNKVHKIFRDLGYRLASFSTGYGFTEPGSEFDRVVSYEKSWWEPTQFEIMLMDFTPLLRILRYGGIDFGHESWRRQLLFVLEHLHVPAKESSEPVFVQAHLMAPHAPFVFRADGGSQEPAGVFSLIAEPGPEDSMDVMNRLYVEQIQGLNPYVEAAVDRILEVSENPPIIAIVADHGAPRLQLLYEEGLKHTLLMVLLPGADANQLPNDMNLVQLFPLIFGTSFGLDVPMPIFPE